MSPTTALREDCTPAPAPVGHRPDSRLQLLPRPTPRLARTSFITLLVTVMGLGFLGVLILNTSLQQGAYQLRDLERMTGALADRRAVLAQRLAVLEAPSRLAGEARLLGMVPNENPVFLRISDGAVLGVPQPAPTPAAPAVPDLGPAELRLLDPVQSSALRMPPIEAVPPAATEQLPDSAAEQPATSSGDKSPTDREERAGTARDQRPGTARGGQNAAGTDREDHPGGSTGNERTASSRDEHERTGTSRDEQPRTGRGDR